MKNLILGVSLLFVASFSFAGGTTSYGEITHLYVNGQWTMALAPAIDDNPDNCQNVTYYAIEPNDPNYDALHATLMAAHMSGKKVRFYVNGCGGQNGLYPHIISVWVN